VRGLGGLCGSGRDGVAAVKSLSSVTTGKLMTQNYIILFVTILKIKPIIKNSIYVQDKHIC
jgi:hypothetical protein